MRPVLVRPLLLPFPIDRANSARVGVAMPDASASRVNHASYASPVSRRTMLRIAAPGFERRRVDPNRVPLHQVRVRQPLQHPREHRLVGVRRRSAGACATLSNGPAAPRAARTRNCRMLSESAARHAMARSESSPHNSRAAAIGNSAPAPDSAARCYVGIELRALCLDEDVDARVVDGRHPIQLRIERMPGALRQIRRGDPHTCRRSRFPFLPIAIHWSIRTESPVSG